jgi:ribosome-associated protein
MKINSRLNIDDAEIKFSFISCPGPGGQNVNKVATGVQLRFNVLSSPSLPEEVRLRLISLLGKKLTVAGYLIIKATRYRTQNRNKTDAITRFQDIVQKAALPPKKRKKTKPTKAAKAARLDNKKMRAKTKTLRKNKGYDNL